MLINSFSVVKFQSTLSMI